MKIGLFYGSSTCYTEMAAEKIRDILGEEFIDLHNVQECDITLMQEYDILILGIPTWDFGDPRRLARNLGNATNIKSQR